MFLRVGTDKTIFNKNNGKDHPHHYHHHHDFK